MLTFKCLVGYLGLFAAAVRPAKNSEQLILEELDHCEEQVKALYKELGQKLEAQDQGYQVQALKDVLQKSELRFTPVELSGSQVVCCCHKGRCEADESGVDGARAVEVHAPERCCKQQMLGECPAAAQVANSTCHSMEKRMLDSLLATAVSSTQHTKKECQDQLEGVIVAMRNWAGKNVSLHGHWIRSIHSLHLAEIMAYQLFITGTAFLQPFPGAKLFEVNSAQKVLSMGTSDLSKWGAGLGSTKLGQLVLKEGDWDSYFSSCNFEAMVKPFRKAMATSFLLVQPEIPVTVVLNGSQAKLESSTFWELDLASLGENPPQNLSLVSLQLPCIELVQALNRRVEELTGRTRSAELRWLALKSFTCQQGDKLASPYPPPLWRAEDLRPKLRAKYLVSLGFDFDWLQRTGFTRAQELKDAGFTAKHLKESGFNLEQLMAADYPVAAFRDALFTAAELKKANFGAAEMRSGGYTAVEMREAEYLPEALKKVGFRVKELKEAGFLTYQNADAAKLKEMNHSADELREVEFTPAQMKAAGYSAEEMKLAGFRSDELAPAGYTLPELKAAGYYQNATLADLKAKGHPAKELAEENHTAEELHEVGYDAKQMKDAGFAAKTLRKVGYTFEQLKSAVYDAKDLKDADFSAKRLKEAGFSGEQLREANYSAEDMKEAEFLATDMKLLGYSAKELRAAQYQATSMKEAKFSCSQMKAAGFTADEFKSAGFDAGQLRQAKFTLKQIFSVGYKPSDLRHAGFTAEEMQKDGLTAAEMKEAGFKASELDFSAGDLRKGGYGVSELMEANFTAKQLKEIGFFASDLVQFPVKDLRDAGFDARDLKAHFTVGTLKSADFSASLMKAADFTMGELKTAGYTAQELKGAGYSAADFRNSRKFAVEEMKRFFSLEELVKGGYNFNQFYTYPHPFTAAELKKEHFSCHDPHLKVLPSLLKKGWWSAADGKLLGCSLKELKDAGYERCELYHAFGGDRCVWQFSLSPYQCC